MLFEKRDPTDSYKGPRCVLFSASGYEPIADLKTALNTDYRKTAGFLASHDNRHYAGFDMAADAVLERLCQANGMTVPAIPKRTFLSRKKPRPEWRVDLEYLPSPLQTVWVTLSRRDEFTDRIPYVGLGSLSFEPPQTANAA